MTSLETISSHAQERNLEFVIGGGHAVITHGYPRATFDLDLIIRRSDQAGWKTFVLELGYALFHEAPTFLQFNAPDQKSFPLDLMLVNDDTFTKLMAEAVAAPAGSSGAKVVSLRHLLALKCHAIKYGHRGRIVKDADDVIRLVQVNRLDMNAAEFRELFLKHGTEEFYEKVRRTSAEN